MVFAQSQHLIHHWHNAIALQDLLVQIVKMLFHRIQQLIFALYITHVLMVKKINLKEFWKYKISKFKKRWYLHYKFIRIPSLYLLNRLWWSLLSRLIFLKNNHKNTINHSQFSVYRTKKFMLIWDMLTR